MNIMPVSFQKFHCEICEFGCSKQSNYNKHILTAKHINRTNPHFLEQKNAMNIPAYYTCKKCSKKYKARNSLWYHEQQCGLSTTSIEQATSLQVDNQMQTNLILELVKQNQEFKQLLIEQNKTIIEVAKNSQTNYNTINNSNSHNNNKTFNLQVFLNETCKDAMNIKDFIQSLELTLSDLEKVGELGYAEGISRMFIKGLNSLDITKRPIHCSDVKREIMHIKHEDKWEKDNANQDKLKNIIKQLTHKNIMMLDDWKKANPGCTAYDSKKYDRYLKLTMESMGPTDEDAEKRDFNKIIRRVAENTTIDKKYLVV